MRPQAVARALSVPDSVPGGTIAILDRRGFILARNRNADLYVGSPATADMVEAVRQGKEGTVESVTKDGVPVLTAISRGKLTGWSVLAAVPKRDLLSLARGLLALAAILLLALLAFAAVASIWIGRSVLRAVEGLVQTTEAISRGEKPARLATGIAETDFVSEALHNTLLQTSQREQELGAAKQRLEELVQKRSAELAEASRQLAAANRELESFAHIAVHDLREPLRTIHGFSGSLREDFDQELPPEARLYTERIENAASRMTLLLESIFAYARVAEPKGAQASVNLNAVLEEVLRDLELRLRETGGEVRARELGWVAADPAALHQILLNLIGNALKFHREGVPPLVELESGQVGSDLHLVIKDNGIGFEPRHAERIFLPFERLETTRRFEGTGMGLAIVRRMVERQGGRIHASSVPGAGSRFVAAFRAASSVATAPEGMRGQAYLNE
jgi:signal transduction histidine kinase